MFMFIHVKVNNFVVWAPIVHVGGSFYVFSGWSGEYGKTIGRLEVQTRKWSKAGDMVSGREGHNVIYDGQFFIVVGGSDGSDALKTEKCAIVNEEMACSNQLPQLSKYAYYPELFLVPQGYCDVMPS